MASIFIRAIYNAPDGDAVDVTELISTTQSRGTDIKSSRAELSLKNCAYRDKSGGESIFVEDGGVEVYCDYSPIDTSSSSQLLLAGKIRELTPKFSESGSSYSMSVSDNTVLMLGKIHSFTYTNKTPSEIITQMIGIETDGAVTTNNVSTTKSGGGVFPSIERYGLYYKPLYDWVKELSDPAYTGENRSMIFYVDKDDDLHWFYPDDNSDGSITEGVDDIYSINMKRNADKVVNMIIYNSGQDLNGNGTLWYYFDATSKSNVLKMKYQPMTDISRDWLYNEILAGNLVESSGGSVPYQGKLYVPATSGTTSWGESFSTLDDYKSKFRTKIRNDGESRASTITKRFGKLLWNGQVAIRGTNDFTAGDLITVTSRTIGINNYKLRVVDVTHSIGVDGWVTTLELSEDETAITS
jgi:hypothetical protein